MSNWMFACSKSKSQQECTEYERDPLSRGADQQIDGCPSCIHRVPYNAATEVARILFSS